MGNNYPLVTSVLSLMLVGAIIATVEDVVHLDLAPLRKLGGDAVPNTSAIVNHANTSLKNDSKIYCSDSTFPSDIVCDLSSIERVKVFRLQPVTTNFYLKYSHPTRAQTKCFVSFENSDDASPSRLAYKSFSCYDDSPDLNSTVAGWLSRVEWRIERGEVTAVPDSSLPEALKVGDAVELEIEDRSTENLSFKCKRRFKKVNAGEPRPPSSVAFDFDLTACISTAPPPEPPMLSEVRSCPEEVTP